MFLRRVILNLSIIPSSTVKLADYKKLEADDLIIHIQKGDEVAFQCFYDLYRPKIYQIALQYLKSNELAKEVVQEVFLKIWIGRAELNKISSIKPWLFKITKNNVLNKFKRLVIELRAKEYFSVHVNPFSSDTEEKIYDREYNSLLKKAINSLPEQQKKVFELARFEKLSYERIGQELGLSPLTVKTHMARALKNIRAKMNEYGVHLPVIFLFLKNFF